MAIGMMVVLGGVALVFLMGIVIYNGLVSKKNNIEEAFSGIDVQLKKRYDLIPNLVQTAKTYMKHESDLLEKLVSLRSQALSTSVGSEANMKLNSEITSSLQGVKVAVENYPELRSIEAFTSVQRSLNEVEEQLAASRRFFNSAVVDYNKALEQFPSNFIASMMGYQRKAVFEAVAAERQNVSVENLFKS